MAIEWKARLDRPVTVPLLHVGLADQLARLKHACLLTRASAS